MKKENMDAPLVSIVVPVYNVSAYLNRSISSIEKIENVNFEAIFINDGSQDNSLAILREYEKKNDYIKVIDKENTGVADTRNLGIKLAKGKYLYFMDPDDWVEENIFDVIPIMEEKNLDLIIFGINKISYGNIEETTPFLEQTYSDQKDFHNAFANLFYLLPMNAIWNKIFRLDYLIKEEIEFPNWVNGQDGGFMNKVYRNVSRVGVHTLPLYNFVSKRENSATSTFKPERVDTSQKNVLSLNSLFSYWNKDKELNYVLNDFIYIELISFAGFESAKEIKDKELRKKYMDKVLNLDVVKKALSSFNFFESHLSLKSRILFFLLSKKGKGLVSAIKFIN